METWIIPGNKCNASREKVQVGFFVPEDKEGLDIPSRGEKEALSDIAGRE